MKLAAEMKKILLGYICFLAGIISAQSQTLYGLTSYGGNEGWGTLIKFTPATNNLTVAKSFEGFPAAPLYTNLIQASDGKLYGMTNFGGNHVTGGWLGQGGGAIFSLNPSTGAYAKLKNFEGIDGANPHGSLMQAVNGKLYGMTFQGGSNDLGVIFSFDPSTSTYTKLKDLDLINGAHPHGGLVQASNGKLYGMTREGGSNDYGVIFSFDPATSTYTKLKDFDLSNGGYPEGGLLQASDGKLYGMTVNGGSGSTGVIFSFDPGTSAYTMLKDFSNTNSGNPNGNLVQANDGKLYGTTAVSGTANFGAIFSFDPSTFIFTKLKEFDYTTGRTPNGSLVQAANGKLYGTTRQGGTNNRGLIFSLDPSTATYTKLKNFDVISGADPFGGLVRAGDGKLYGMTNGGGAAGYGVVYSLDPSASVYTKLKDFEATNGRDPSGSLVQAGNGKFYGMTTGGGTRDSGVIFSFDPATSIYTKLKDFDGVNGGKPFGSLIKASNQKLYGMTAWGGAYGYGVIFSFDPTTSIYTKLKDFDGVEAGNPFGSLVQAANGKLYGMTYMGVNSIGLSQGIIFSFDPSNSAFTKLKAFEITDGSQPRGSLVQAGNGKLYGVAEAGTNGFGVIFSFDPSTSSFTKLKDFSFADGSGPVASLVQAGNGKLYGMTNGGGSDGYGVIFSFEPSTSTYTKLKDFGGADGGNPNGYLMQASDGKLYGMTSNNDGGGGYSFTGVIFSFDPGTFSYTKLKDFNVTNGANPNYGSGFIELTAVATGVADVTSLLYQVKLFPNPAQGSANISFVLEKPGNVSVKIVDVSGRIIKVLAHARFEKGQHELKWNTAKINAGLYLLQFDAGAWSETKKLTVIN